MRYAIKQIYRPSPSSPLKVRFVDLTTGKIVTDLKNYTVLEQGALNIGGGIDLTSSVKKPTKKTTTKKTTKTGQGTKGQSDGFDRGSGVFSNEGPVPGVTSGRQNDTTGTMFQRERTPENNFGWIDSPGIITKGIGLAAGAAVPALAVVGALAEGARRGNNVAAYEAANKHYFGTELSAQEKFGAFVSQPSRLEVPDSYGTIRHIDLSEKNMIANPAPEGSFGVVSPRNFEKEFQQSKQEQVDESAVAQNQQQSALGPQPQEYKDIYDDPGFIQKLAEDPNAKSLLDAMGYRYEKPGSVPPGGFVNPYVGTQEAFALSDKVNQIASDYRQGQPQAVQTQPSRFETELQQQPQGFIDPTSFAIQRNVDNFTSNDVAASPKVIDTILNEAQLNDYNDILAVASVIQNRSNMLGVPPEDVVIDSQFMGANKSVSQSKETARDLAIQAWNEVQTKGPINNATFYATPEAVKNLPPGLTQITQTTGHQYFIDPQLRTIETAQGYKQPDIKGVYAQTPQLSNAATASARQISEKQQFPAEDFMATRQTNLFGEQTPLGSVPQGQAVANTQTSINEDLGGLGFAAPGQPGVMTNEMGIPVSQQTQPQLARQAQFEPVGTPVQAAQTGFVTDVPVQPFNNSNWDETGRFTGNIQAGGIQPGFAGASRAGQVYENASIRNQVPDWMSSEPRMERSFIYDNFAGINGVSKSPQAPQTIPSTNVFDELQSAMITKDFSFKAALDDQVSKGLISPEVASNLQRSLGIDIFDDNLMGKDFIQGMRTNANDAVGKSLADFVNKYGTDMSRQDQRYDTNRQKQEANLNKSIEDFLDNLGVDKTKASGLFDSIGRSVFADQIGRMVGSEGRGFLGGLSYSEGRYAGPDTGRNTGYTGFEGSPEFGGQNQAPSNTGSRDTSGGDRGGDSGRGFAGDFGGGPQSPGGDTPSGGRGSYSSDNNNSYGGYFDIDRDGPQ